MTLVLVNSQSAETPNQKRERVLGELSLAIEDARAEGTYRCCIDPPCTMCYMGDWLWEDGKCMCDDMIAHGNFDDVCPQCKKALEEGQCTSAEIASCSFD
ncbi:MAG: hypothetical protein ABIG39_01885 [Candidatus Micrarchaeota archaeon]